MITKTKRALVVAALVVTSGAIGLELTGEAAQAEEPNSYTVSRINEAFEVVAEMPPVDPMRVPIATKGDLPIPLDCLRLATDTQADCADLAYKVLTEPSSVVASSFGSTTTLLRVDAMAVAEVFGKVFWNSDQRQNSVE